MARVSYDHERLVQSGETNHDEDDQSCDSMAGKGENQLFRSDDRVVHSIYLPAMMQKTPSQTSEWCTSINLRPSDDAR